MLFFQSSSLKPQFPSHRNFRGLPLQDQVFQQVHRQARTLDHQDHWRHLRAADHGRQLWHGLPVRGHRERPDDDLSHIGTFAWRVFAGDGCAMRN